MVSPDGLWSAEQSLSVRSALRWYTVLFFSLIQKINPLPKVLCLFPGGVYTLEQGSTNYGPPAISGPPPVFVNKVLLEHSLVISFSALYGCFPTMVDFKAELSSCNRDCMICKVWNIHDLVLYRKSVLTPVLWFCKDFAKFPIRPETSEITMKVCLITLYTAYLRLYQVAKFDCALPVSSRKQSGESHTKEAAKHWAPGTRQVWSNHSMSSHQESPSMRSAAC